MSDDRCACPHPSTCPCCSRMYPCRCEHCPYQNASEEADEHETCSGCGNEIDPDTCYCGSPVDEHGVLSGHGPVPMGCTCAFEEDDASLDLQPSLYHPFRQNNGNGWGILKQDAIGSAGATVVAADLSPAEAAEQLAVLRLAERSVS